MKDSENGVKPVRDALIVDDKAHWGKANTHGSQPFSLHQEEDPYFTFPTVSF